MYQTESAIDYLPHALALIFALVVLLYKPIEWTFVAALAHFRRERTRTRFTMAMNPAFRAKIEEMRADTQRLSGKPCSTDDLFEQAVENYCNLAEAHLSGSTFSVRLPDGTEKPFPIFAEA